VSQVSTAGGWYRCPGQSANRGFGTLQPYRAGGGVATSATTTTSGRIGDPAGDSNPEPTADRRTSLRRIRRRYVLGGLIHESRANGRSSMRQGSRALQGTFEPSATPRPPGSWFQWLPARQRKPKLDSIAPSPVALHPHALRSANPPRSHGVLRHPGPQHPLASHQGLHPSATIRLQAALFAIAPRSLRLR